MSCEDGLVMQLHPGVLRDHSDEAHRLYGPDRGFDIPVAIEFTRSLRPLLQSFGRHPALRLILFTVDETVHTRELAPSPASTPPCASARRGGSWTARTGCAGSAPR
ncbi:glucuronate isomerase [Dactylosporangium cerinum]